jgi:N-dimethylarginine dimethylaminohydrolase
MSIKLKITHEEISYLFPEKITKMSHNQLLAENNKRIKNVPGFREGRPPEPWYLHDHVSFEEEVEHFFGKKWGARGNGRLKAVLLSPPTSNEIRQPYYSDPEGYWVPNRALPPKKPDLDRWLDQYHRLVETYEKLGVLVYEVEPPEPALGPYGFIRWFSSSADAAVVIDGGAIIPRAAWNPISRGREIIWTRAFTQIGVPILYTLHGTGIGELGGCVWLDDNHFVVTEGIVMNREGIEQIKPIFSRHGINLINARVPGFLDNIHWPAGGTSHPDMWVAFPDVKTAVLYPPMVEYNFVKFLKRLDFDIIEASPEEYLRSGCNMVVVEPGKVITAAGSDNVRREMEKRGIEVIAIPYDEPAGGAGAGGAIDCTTCQLIREPGPLVEQLLERPLQEVAPELAV